jgi:hypothetical protein
MTQTQQGESMNEEDLKQTKADALKHVEAVRLILSTLCSQITRRGQEHDRSKLLEPELSGYAEIIPKLKKVEYGSEGYLRLVKELSPATKHHTSINRHHPEFFDRGVDDMNLIDLIEMVADWKAASLRSNSSFTDGLEINRKRFNLTPQLTRIIANTADMLEDAVFSEQTYHKIEEGYDCFGSKLAVGDCVVPLLNPLEAESENGLEIIGFWLLKPSGRIRIRCLGILENIGDWKPEDVRKWG